MLSQVTDTHIITIVVQYYVIISLMFSIIDKLIDKIKIDFLNRGDSYSKKQKQITEHGDNIGRDKIIYNYNDRDKQENSNLKDQIKKDYEKLNAQSKFVKDLQKSKLLHFTEANINFGTTTPAGNLTIFYKKDYIVWQSVLSISNRDVEIRKIVFQKNGFTYNTDIKNFRLYIDKNKISSISDSDIDNYIIFDLIYKPIKLRTGARIIELVADIEKSADGKCFSISLITDGTDFFDSEMNTKIELTQDKKELTSGEQKVKI